MAELLEAPDPDRAIWEYLNAVQEVPAAGRLPENHETKSEFIRVRMGGGSDVDVAAEQDTIFVECYAGTVQRAKQISRRCDAWIAKAGREGWLLTVAVRSIPVISRPQELPDPLTKQARFTATYAPILRRSPVNVP